MNSPDNSGLIKLGIAGAAAYYAYSNGWLSFLGIGTAASASAVPTVAAGGATSPAGTTPSTAVVPAGPPPPSLDSLYTLLVNAAGAAHTPGQNMGPDDYNSLLVGIYPAAGPLPDPNSLFAATGWARPNGMPIASYWSLTSAWLQANKGMSGLNGYAGLGALAMQRGWGY